MNENYPCVLNEVRWFVMLTGTSPDREEATLVISSGSDETAARAEYAVLAERYGDEDVTFERCCPIYVARCVVCGEGPWHDDPTTDPPFREWDYVLDDIRGFPGWVATSEEQVFCPIHASDKEN
ncbi:hypothetical protein [Amycolatopsis sp. NPDC001319]|uniref:hypothetical protein n=1 Tax=unclassified Amycolatopsis TaxID=2618356 RepID=UPI00369500AF